MVKGISAGVACALLLSACAVENPDHVEDTTGAETGWGCAAGACDTIRETFSAPAPECGAEGTELRVGAGALAILCAVSRGSDGSEDVHQLTCRPLACSDGLDCPQWAAREYGCVAGICQVADATGWRLDRLDLTALCLWDVARHTSCSDAAGDPEVTERLALVDLACPEEECVTVPAGCLEP